ncbi:MAG: hypothetical protein HY704_12905 [Gemmatimonadetes bacterium]|nr:hypothetical protein [Gemmatimonadota bacterium]
MSLIRVRRERKAATGLDLKRVKSPWMLLGLLVLVAILMWLLSRVS